jgi:hypothetical protein
MLTTLAVRRRLTSTSSLSATSTPASRPPPVVSNPTRTNASHNSSQWRRLDLQVRRYRQAYHREVREGTAHFFSSCSTYICDPCARRLFLGLSLEEGHFWWGCASFSRTRASLLPAFGNLNTMPHIRALHRKHHGFGHGLRHPSPSSLTFHYADDLHRKPPNSARVPSSTHGSLTSSRPSVSVVSPSISPSGSSKPPSTTSPLVCLHLSFI